MTGRKGVYMENPSILDKYVRRDTSEYPELFHLTYLQFAKRYTSTNTEPKDSNWFRPKEYYRSENKEDVVSKIDFIITHDFETRNLIHHLPKYLKLTDLEPGESRFMKLRSTYVARLHKFNKLKFPHEFYYSELQLYKPFINEQMLHPDSLENCLALYDELSEHNNIRRITNVKTILMEHLEVVEEGTEKAKEVYDSNAGMVLDNANEQDNADCGEEESEIHDDFLARNPDNLDDFQSTLNPANLYKRIELYPSEKLENLVHQLDKEQRCVVDVGVDFANNLVKAKHGLMPKPKAPLVVVQGGAGTGKSTVIDIMSQLTERILRTPGDDPAHPYIIKAAFTGTAAANIMGQTMHNAFCFNFGNQYLTLGDKSRDERRAVLQNLQIVIVDEYSMIKADMLYQLDLRLRELKQVQDCPFGGVAVFFFGDIMQLRPVQSRYIFEEPLSETFQLSYRLDPLWRKFTVVTLLKNHRQGEDRDYADILNRIRVGDIQQEDIDKLGERVIGYEQIPKDALVVTCKNKEVNLYNEKRLCAIKNSEHIIEAVTMTQSNKVIKPPMEASGAIRNTPLQRTLKVKIGARVMLTHNLDTCDSLTNGTFGEVIDIELNQMKQVKRLIICFDNERSGKERRKNYMQLQKKYYPKLATPIDKIEFHYSLSKKQASNASNAIAIQFPIRLAFAVTAHKIQGATIKKPNSLVIDLRTVMEAAQAYVMLSRIQAISQLFIIVDVCPKKLYASPIALKELEIMNLLSIKRNQPWKLVTSCNVRSLKFHFQDLLLTPNILRSDVICLQEIWLKTIPEGLFEIEGFHCKFNLAGRGKGIVTYHRPGYYHIEDKNSNLHQMTKVSSKKYDIINCYRSVGASSNMFIDALSTLLDRTRETFIVGDLNLCVLSEPQSPILLWIRSQGFNQLVTKPTHIQGRLIDCIFHFEPTSNNQDEIIVKQMSPYFTDHDILLVHNVRIANFNLNVIYN